MTITAIFHNYNPAEDRFDTYINQVRIAKIITGDYADPNQEFTFTVKLCNSVDGHYPEGVQVSYTGGVVDGMTAEKPADGTLTVSSNGEVTFKLKHGQYINFTHILGSLEVKETSSYGYTMSWENVLLTESGESKTQDIGYDNKTDVIAIGEKEII